MLGDLMRNVRFYFGKVGENEPEQINWCGNMLELTQNDDYHDTLYTLVIKSDERYSYWTGKRRDGTGETRYACAVKAVGLVYADRVEEIPYVDREFRIPVDFDKRAQKVVLYFKYDLSEPLELELKYTEADKEAWDKRVAAEEAERLEKEREEARQNIIKTAHISHRTGENLVNIYFQPCSENYAKTVIKLYAAGVMIAEYECGKGVYFKAVTGLAYGGYEYTVSQFDGEGAELFVTGKIYFSLDKPRVRSACINVNGNW